MSDNQTTAPPPSPADEQVRRNHSESSKAGRRRLFTRQKERRYGGAPIIHKPAGRPVISGARFALFFTAVAWLVYLIEQIIRASRVQLSTITLIETIVYLILVTLLTASAAAYLLARLGYFERIRDHKRLPRSTIDNLFDRQQPSMTVLIPSYREEERIIRLTLLSAALQEYPELRVVLLIDDPPQPQDPAYRELLQRSRALIHDLTDQLTPPREEVEAALTEFEAEKSRATIADSATLERLAKQFDRSAAWFEMEQAEMERIDHIEEFFSIEVLERLARDLRTTANALREVAQVPNASISRRRVHQLYTRLLHIFQAEFASFERKQYASLSHEPNKAMNLNSYISLMGGAYNVVESPGGQVLIPADDMAPDFIIPDSDYLLTLDADSILLPEYCLRLVYFMEQPENDRVAIAQTPYSAYRGTPSKIERIAGATTDIQHIVHLGMTHYQATSWVGANAVIRKTALEDIRETYEENGFLINRYISDRTVIEDTESTIDLRNHGWQLFNYPERLSYSATPPDFGSLVIQRRRWANGGLVIFPKLFRRGFRRKEDGERLTPAELFLRTSYLVSISWATLSLLLLLFYPFDGELLSRFAVLTAVPYWWMMANDLKRIGYKRRDIFRIYGFNLLLLPVNLAGTLQSLVQVIGGQRTAFARTPKVKDRTIAPLLYIVVPTVLALWSAWTLLQDLATQAYMHGLFAAANLFTITYALFAFLGFRQITVDIFVNLRNFIYKPARTTTRPSEVPHWASVLYVGSSVTDEIEVAAPLAVALATEDLFTNGHLLTNHPPAPTASPAPAAAAETDEANHPHRNGSSNGQHHSQQNGKETNQRREQLAGEMILDLAAGD